MLLVIRYLPLSLQNAVYTLDEVSGLTDCRVVSHLLVGYGVHLWLSLVQSLLLSLCYWNRNVYLWLLYYLGPCWYLLRVRNNILVSQRILLIKCLLYLMLAVVIA